MSAEDRPDPLVLELDVEDRLPAGRVRDPAGDVHPFHGWLELMSAIAAAADAHQRGRDAPR